MSINQEIPTVELTESQKKELPGLIKMMEEAKAKSYSPYSEFRVGCALLTQSGKKYSGSNVENSSYPLSICAERTTFTKAITEGENTFDLVVIGTDVEDRFITPCGACRQFMIEFGEATIVLVNPKTHATQCYKLSSLLPLNFDPKDLKAARVK